VEGGANSAIIGQTVTIDVVVYNNGTTDENFQIAVSWGSVQVTTKNFTLAHGQSSQNQPFMLTWDTSIYLAGTNPISVAGTNPISAQVSQAKGETNINDNNLTGPSFTLSAPSQGFSATTIAAIVGGVGVAAVGGGLFFLRRRRKPAAQLSAQKN
jgi:LPXTG-motif cell wall-anchored protein